MKITLKQLTEWSACKEGVELFKSKCGESVDLKKFAKIAISLEKFDYAWWTIKHLLKKEQSVKIAIYTAEKVIDVFEKKYPNDDRPRKAIEAAKAWLKEPTGTNRAAAKAAAAAAAAAAANDDAAANAANDDAAANAANDDAAANAAYAAVYAAAAANAADAANAAAAYATVYAAKTKLKTDILNYAIKVLVSK